MSLFGLIMAFLLTPWLVISISRCASEKRPAWKPHQLLPGVIRCYLWTIVILGISTKLSYLEEKYWVAQDKLGARSGLFDTKFEALTFDALKKESDTLLGPRL